MKVDKKGRVSFPAELRAELPANDSRLMLFRPADTDWVNGCVYSEFDQVLAEMQAALPGSAQNPSQRLAANILGLGDDDVGDFYAESVMVQLDSEGRFVMPAMVGEALAIVDTVTFVGRRAVFQLWHPETYEAHRAQSRARRVQRYAGSVGGGAA